MRWGGLGYVNYYQVLNAKDYGIPQNRERVFTISILDGGAFEFPPKQELKLHLKDLLEEEVDQKYYLSDEQVASFRASTEKAQAKGNGFKFEPIERERERSGAYDRHESRKQADGQLYSRVNRLGGVYDKPGEQHQAGSVYAKNGLSPTLSTMQGGNLQPFIVASRGRNPGNPSDRTKGAPTVQRLEPRKDGITNTITSV